MILKIKIYKKIIKLMIHQINTKQVNKINFTILTNKFKVQCIKLV